MEKLLIVGVGGFAGATMRFLLAGYVQDMSGSIYFPYGTLTVNIAGCLLIGFLLQLDVAYGFFSPETRLLVFIGFLGAFTTFSTFSYETFGLLRDGETLPALVSVAAHLILGLGAVWFGQTLATWITRLSR